MLQIMAEDIGSSYHALQEPRYVSIRNEKKKKADAVKEKRPIQENELNVRFDG